MATDGVPRQVLEVRGLRRRSSSGRQANSCSSLTSSSRTSRSAARHARPSGPTGSAPGPHRHGTGSKHRPRARRAARTPRCRSVRRRAARCSARSASSSGSLQGPAACRRVRDPPARRIPASLADRRARRRARPSPVLAPVWPCLSVLESGLLRAVHSRTLCRSRNDPPATSPSWTSRAR